MHQAFLEIQQRLVHDNKLDAMDGVLVQPMILDGVELMIGVTQDPLFGPLIGFGLAGIHVEILKDICFRVTPPSPTAMPRKWCAVSSVEIPANK